MKENENEARRPENQQQPLPPSQGQPPFPFGQPIPPGPPRQPMSFMPDNLQGPFVPPMMRGMPPGQQMPPGQPGVQVPPEMQQRQPIPPGMPPGQPGVQMPPEMQQRQPIPQGMPPGQPGVQMPPEMQQRQPIPPGMPPGQPGMPVPPELLQRQPMPPGMAPIPPGQPMPPGQMMPPEQPPEGQAPQPPMPSSEQPDGQAPPEMQGMPPEMQQVPPEMQGMPPGQPMPPGGPMPPGPPGPPLPPDLPPDLPPPPPPEMTSSGTQRYFLYLENDRRREDARLMNQQIEEQIRAEKAQRAKQRKAAPVLPGKNRLADDLFGAAQKEKRDRTAQKLMTKKILLFVAFLFLSIGLNVFSFHLPYTPTVTVLEFSAFPALLACTVLGPLWAPWIILLKNVIYLTMNPAALPSVPNKIILEVVFVYSTYAVFCLLIYSDWVEKRCEIGRAAGKKYLPRFMIIGGVFGSVLTACLSLATMKYVLLPLLLTMNGYTHEVVANSYVQAYNALVDFLPFLKGKIPQVQTLTAGVLFYNLPLNILKYLICTLFSAFLYTPLFATVKNREEPPESPENDTKNSIDN